MNNLSVLAVIDRVDYTTWWRVLWPFEELKRHGYKADVVMYADFRKVDPTPYDIIITPRVTVDGAHWLSEYLHKLQKLGKTWIYEADDNLWDAEFVHRQVAREGEYLSRADRRRLQNNYERQRQQRLWLLTRCDGVTVSTSTLAYQISALTRKVEVVPNLINVRQFELDLDRKRRVVSGLTIGWTGGERREADLQPLGEAWSILAERYPEVTFVVFGHEPETLMGAVPIERLAVIEWAPIKWYPPGLKNIDIGCCVLPDTSWNRAKSWNKWMEFSLAGVPCVVSPTVYGGVVENGYNALVADTVDEWVIHIENLIINPEMRTTISQNARVDIKLNHNLNVDWEAWPRAWEQLSTKRLATV